MARRKDHTREELHALLIDSARSLVAEKGQNALTARNVATKAKYVPGTIYNIFGSMDVLTLHVNAGTLDYMYDFLSETRFLNGRNNLKKNLLSLAGAYRTFIKNNKELWLLLFSYQYINERHKIVWYQEKVDKLLRILESALTSITNDKKDNNLSLSARTLWSSFQGLCYLEHSGHLNTVSKQASFEDMTECLIDNF
ncbi:TetR/AcrR family transcriptional regulator, partial [bacterium]|nr:TetR/AcrR family transcriptional regulator [bacterium]